MSLFGSIQMGANTLQAMQIGLHVVGNISPTRTRRGTSARRCCTRLRRSSRLGGLTIGPRRRDRRDRPEGRRVPDRPPPRCAASDRASADVQRDAFADLETLIGELSRNRPEHVAQSNFFNSDRRKSPSSDGRTPLRSAKPGDSAAARPSTADIRRLASRTFGRPHRVQHADHERSADEINNLTEEIRVLNLRITTLEAGGVLGQRRRGAANRTPETPLAALAELIDIRRQRADRAGRSISRSADELPGLRGDPPRTSPINEVEEENGRHHRPR